MLFSYDRNAEREIVRFWLTGVALGLITGAVWGMLAIAMGSPLVAGATLGIVLFLALFPKASAAKTLYWNLAILLQSVGLVLFGVIGGAIGLGLWVAAIATVPALRYVLRRDNVISVLLGAGVTWIVSIALFGVSAVGPLEFEVPLQMFTVLGAYVGGAFWGISKVISSCFKEFRFRTANSAP